jgi:hypothetical protein
MKALAAARAGSAAALRHAARILLSAMTWLALLWLGAAITAARGVQLLAGDGAGLLTLSAFMAATAVALLKGIQRA